MRTRVIVITAALAATVAGAAWVSRAAPEHQPAAAMRTPDGCPDALRDMPPFWGAIRGAAVGAYVLADVHLCPGSPRVVRTLHDDIGWISSGGGVTAVVSSGGTVDQVALFDGRDVRPLRELNTQGTVITPAVSAAGDIAVVVHDARTGAQSLQVIRKGATSPHRLYDSPPGHELSTPSWNSRGDLLVVQRPNPGVAGSASLVLLRQALASAASPDVIPTDRPNTTIAMWLDDARVVLGDYTAAREARPALFDITDRKSRLLTLGLTPVATLPGRAALLTRDNDRRLILLTGKNLEESWLLGAAGNELIGQGTFVSATP